MARCVSDFNHFSFRRGNEKRMAQKRKTHSTEAENVDIAYFFAYSHGGIVWIVRVI